MVGGGVVCTAVRYGVLMQCHVRQLNNVMKQSSLINKVINEKDLTKMFCRNIRD